MKSVVFVGELVTYELLIDWLIFIDWPFPLPRTSFKKMKSGVFMSELVTQGLLIDWLIDYWLTLLLTKDQLQKMKSVAFVNELMTYEWLISGLRIIDWLIIDWPFPRQGPDSNKRELNDWISRNLVSRLCQQVSSIPKLEELLVCYCYR